MAIPTLTIRQWHRRIGLFSGIFLIFQGLTGAIAQHRFLLMQWSTPHLFKVEPTGEPAPPADILSIVQAAEPNFRAAHLMYPDRHTPGTAVIVMGSTDPNKPDMSGMVLVDQYQGKVIASGRGLAGWVGLATTLHLWLIFGTPGRIFVTIFGSAVLVFTVLGLMLWWRTRGLPGSSRSTAVRLHRTTGAAAGLLLLIITGTGLALNVSIWWEKSTGRSVFSNNMAHSAGQTGGPGPSGHEGEGHAGHGGIGPAEALQIAKGAVPGQHLSAFGAAGPHGKMHWFAFHDERLRRTDVLVDPKTGAVAGIYPAGVTEKGEGLRSWLFPVHSGFIIGPVGGVLFSLLGLMTLGWGITGVLIWRRGIVRPAAP